MVTFSIRNTSNGNSHRITPIEWDYAEKLFIESTNRGLAACIFIVDDGKYDHPLAGVYLAQNKAHKDFEHSFCCL